MLVSDLQRASWVLVLGLMSWGGSLAPVGLSAWHTKGAFTSPRLLIINIVGGPQ